VLPAGAFMKTTLLCITLGAPLMLNLHWGAEMGRADFMS